MIRFRFQDLEIWKSAKGISIKLFGIAEMMENNKLFRFAEQLRGAGLSMPNNIAEGSGSDSNREFKLFLNYARRSLFECVNMLIIFEEIRLLKKDEIEESLVRLDKLSRQITNFKKTLK